jgi:uncharacterized membrane protein
MAENAAPPTPPPVGPTVGGVSSTGLQESTAAGLSYLATWLTGLIFFLIEKSSPYVRFHAAQSLVVFGILAIAQMVLFPIHFGLSGMLSLAGLALWIYCLIMAFSGKAFRIPIAADLADKLIGSKPLEAPAASSAVPTGPGQPVASGGSKVGLILGIVVASILLLCGGAVAVGFFVFRSLSPIQVDEGGATFKGPDGKVRIEVPTEEEIRETERPQPVRASMEQIQALLPEQVGKWKRQDDYRIQKLGEEESEVTHAQASYRREDETIEVQLWGGMGLGIYASAWIGMVQIEEKDRYVRRTTVSGFKGKEHVERKERRASIWLRVGRFAVLVEQRKTGGPESVREFLQAFNLKAVATTD